MKELSIEDKKLLLKDLSARLPYGVIVNTLKGDGHLCSINQTIFGNEYGVNIKATKRDYFNDNECNIKPYLRPMSSMTDKEKETYYNLCYEEEREELQFGEWAARIHYHDTVDSIDYLTSIHIDFRGLIEKGLAIEVTNEHNPYKK